MKRLDPFRALVIVTVVLAATGLVFRPAEGADSMIGFYPLTAVVMVVAVVFAVRGLVRLLRRGEDYYDAD